MNEKGIERPQWRWDKNAVCKNVSCARPLAQPNKRWRGKQRLYTGRYTGLCPECYQFFKLTGEMRPKKYIGKTWCDCGNEAKHQVELTIGSSSEWKRVKKEIYNLCDACYEEEWQMKNEKR